MKKRILSIVLCLSMFVATFATTMVVSAAEVNAETGYCADISDYRAEGDFTAPTKEGKVFAGWYKDADFTEAIAPSVKSGAAYAKFVDPTVFTIQNQFNKEAHKKSETVDLRIITTIDSEWYAGIQFLFTCAGKEGTAVLPIDTVYTSLVNYESAKTQFCNDSEYFAVEKITGIPAEMYNSEMSITPVYTTYDGTIITGTTRGTESEPLTLATKLPLGTTVLSVRDTSTADTLFFNWEADVDLVTNKEPWGYTSGGWTWEGSNGVYYNGKKCDWVKFYKNGCHYMLLKSDMKFEIVDGDTISVQGTCNLNGEAYVNFAPITVQYNGETGKWDVISRETVTEDARAILSWNTSRSDGSTLFFVSDVAVEHSIAVGAYPSWTDGGVYLDGKKVSVRLVRHGAKNYYFELGTVTINEGSQISLQGTFTLSGQTLTVQPVTFELTSVYTVVEGDKEVTKMDWKVVSRRAIVPKLEFSYTFVDGWWDNIKMLASDTNAIPRSGLIYSSSFVGDGGIYINGEKDQLATIAKHADTGYYVYLSASGHKIIPTDKMTVEIKGVYKHTYSGVEVTFDVVPIKFQFDASDTTLSENGSWKVVTE